MVGDDETNFPHKLLLANSQNENHWKAFDDNSSNDIKLSKTQDDTIRRVSWQTSWCIT